ncbi:MAG TPA: hypothetical protein VE967_12970 [Gemmatimonadaceae bacterium]|nr:hypothetical protein [Gemmatimonadaceae bacterium]
MKQLAILALGLLTPAMQEPGAVRLQHPTGKLTETFTFAGSIRELPDGRVLISDRRENRVVVADFGQASVQAVGRVGQGPGEYEEASPIYALGGDSSIMAEFRRRWFILRREKIIATLAPFEAAAAAVGNEVIIGTDGRGAVLSRKRPAVPSGSSATAAADSVWIVRVAIASGRVDTVARVRDARITTVQIRNDKGQVTSFTQSLANPYDIQEPVAACSDGWLAIVRLDPYRVDWRSPSGSLVRGAQPPVAEPERVTSAEKDAFMARQARFSSNKAQRADIYPEWPSHIPAVEERNRFTAMCSADGKAVVHRARSIAHPEARYDIFDRRGSRVRQVSLAENEFIIGFGSRTVYSVLVDDDGAEHIRRYAWN